MKRDVGMFYNGRQEIGLRELASINTALLSTSDYIFVNANYTIAKANLDDYEHISRVMDDYIEEGIIRLWDYPCTDWSDLVTILPQQDYSYWDRLVSGDEQMEELKQLNDYLSNADSSLERSSMVVDLKKERWHFAICHMLKADQIMLMPLQNEIKTGREQLSNYKYATHQEPAVKKIFDLSGINMHGLALLKASEMKKQIKRSKDFREFISITQKDGLVATDEMDYFNDKLSEFMKALSKEYAKSIPSPFKSLLGHAMNTTALLISGPIGYALSAASEAEGVVNDITSKTFNNKSMLYFTARLARLTDKASKRI